MLGWVRRQRPQQGQAAPIDLHPLRAPDAAPAGTLATARSIQPIPEGQLVEAGDSLDAMLAARPAAPPQPGGRSSRLGGAGLPLLPGHRRRSQRSSVAGSQAESDTLEAAVAELGAVQRHAAEQAALLASCRASAADMRQQVAAVIGAPPCRGCKGTCAWASGG